MLSILGIADIYDQMEAAAEQDRIRKAVQKKPQARTRAEIERIMKKTEDVCPEFFPGFMHQGTIDLSYI